MTISAVGIRGDREAAIARTVLERAVSLQQAPAFVKMCRIPWRLLRARFASVASVPTVVRASLFWGATMTVVLPDPVSTAAYCYGVFDDVVSRMLIDWTRPGSIMLDLGAHLGYFTLLAAHLVGPGGQVHAFEPTPSTFALLRANTADCGNVTANPEAVHERQQIATLIDYGPRYRAWNTFGPGRLTQRELRRLSPQTVEVPCVSVDTYCRTRSLTPSVIKIDAEGAEVHVIAGALGTIAACRPVIIMEVGDHRYPAIIKQVIGCGYEVLRYDGGRIPQVSDDWARDVERYKDVVLVPTAVSP